VIRAEALGLADVAGVGGRKQEGDMNMARRLSIKGDSTPAITITRRSLGKRKLVYIAKANRKFKYPFGRSAVVYIGTTAAGAKRVAASAANKANTLLTQHGVKQLDFYIVTCTPRRNVQTWRKLESALLLAFKHQYGAIPVGNTAGKKRSWRDEREYFRETRLRVILDRYE
jgi:hypothetical protein